MARLPSGRFLIQQIGDHVVLYEEQTEEELLKVPFYADPDVRAGLFAQGVKVLHVKSEEGKIGMEDMEFAIFWLGYFYAYAAVTSLKDR
jgi:hypothetical protein